MFMILIAIVVAGVLGAVLMLYYDSGYQDRHMFAGVAGFVLVGLSAGAALVYAALGFSWLAAEHKANIVNREYGTSYTQEEMFFAPSVIDTVRELDRKRIELNGDLITGDE